ncbi:MAG: hypothetical protein E7499_07670 [Ruminococcus sp.]|nr:hypothetical protein [Ruminococcus sp.]
MRNSKLKKCIASLTAAALMSTSAIGMAVADYSNLSASVNTNLLMADAASSVIITASKGYQEGAYVKWSPVNGATGYNVYCDGVQIDSMLIRQYQGYFRADMVGIKSGSHTIKVVPVINGTEDASNAASQTLTSIAHDRSGFAFSKGKALGAYNGDGTLKSGAVVVYVTDSTKDSVKATIGGVSVTGFQNIVNACQDSTVPVAIRCIGNITDPSTLDKGDLLVDKIKCGLTIEGIGSDTTFNGFGVRIKGSSDVEVRNIGLMNCDSSEGDSVGLQQDNQYCWVHNCDFFYGDAGSDADQAKGDGALDTKKSQYITHSYNHFWDSGKTHLSGNGDTTLNYLTYHHNWYDHSDSRHPLVRVSSAVHCYNNFYDGVAKYGMIARLGSSIFAEENYFKDTNSPILISQQGTDTADGEAIASDDGGMIKSYGNVYDNTTPSITHKDSATNFDCYEASARNEQVPSSYKTVKGGTSYSNFDTASSMYSYTADAGKDVPGIVQAYAGRVDGGDFDWDFSDVSEDKNYNVNTALKSALISYDDKIIAIGSGFKSGYDQPATTTAPITTKPSVTTTTAPSSSSNVAGSFVHNFTENGTSSSFYTITGNLSTSKGTVTYNGKTLTQCLKLESATSISFTGSGKLTLVLSEAAKAVIIDGTSYTSDANGIITAELSNGSHTILKGDTANLFYMVLSASGSVSVSTTAPTTIKPSVTTTTVTNPPSSNTNSSGLKNVVDGAIYCAPNASGTGTKDSPTDVLTAIKNVKAGGTIYLLDGIYKFSETILIDSNNNGTSNAYKTIQAYPGNSNRVVFDFSAQSVSGSNRGIVLDGDYWQFVNFEITKAGDNGMLLSGNNNRIVEMVFNDNQDTGLQLSRFDTNAATVAEWPSNNLVLNCTSKNNCDDATMENADGFAAKLTCGEGNVFDGCMAYNNSDDGWDLYAKEATGPIGVVTIKNSAAFRNGYTEFGEGYGDCDGNGFKLGGAGVGTAHIVENCLAFENLNSGFTDNNNPKLGSLKDCTAYNNGVGGKGKSNYMVYRCSSSTKLTNLMSYTNTAKVSDTGAAGIKLANDKFVGVMNNSVYYNSKYYFAKNDTAMTNGAKLGDEVTVQDSDFKSLSVQAMGTDFHTAWRGADGTINNNGFAETTGTYSSIGYHLSGNGTASLLIGQTGASTTPSITTTTTPSGVTVTKYGDANCDGETDIADVVSVKCYLINPKNYSISAQGIANADVQGNSNGLNVNDVIAISKYALKLIDTLPIN